jgi:hypothetical protein
MCPFIIVLPIVGEIVKTASILSAIAELELDVMGKLLVLLCNSLATGRAVH